MRTTGRVFAVVSTVLLVGLGVTGCNNDTLDSGTQGLTINFHPSPSGSGRFDRANFDVSTLQIRPADPDTASALGTTNLSLRFDLFNADLTKTTDTFYASIALPAGTYVVKQIKFSSPLLVDTDVITSGATCLDRIATFPSGPAAGAVPHDFNYLNPASLTFTVHPGQTVLRLTADVPGLIASYQSAFTCVDDCGSGTSCLTGFDAPTFTAAFLSHITLQ